jgi:hypothetical protein
MTDVQIKRGNKEIMEVIDNEGRINGKKVRKNRKSSNGRNTK